MKVLFVHPSGLMYTEIYLRLEPLGLERVAAACRKAGHEVRLLDLQVFRHKHFRRLLGTWRPDAVAFSLNYLANIPEVVDLARLTRELLPDDPGLRRRPQRPASPRGRSWRTPTARSTA